MLVAGAALLLALALWIRRPSLGGGEPPAASAESAAAARDFSSALSVEAVRLADIAAKSLDAPRSAAEAFAFLRTLARNADGESVVLFDSSRAVAWAGSVRTPVDTLPSPLAFVSDRFFTTLNVTREAGSRRAVASSVIATAPPADKLSPSLVARMNAQNGQALEVYPLSDSARAGTQIVTLAATPVLRVALSHRTAGQVRFANAAKLRARAAGIILVGYLLLLVFGWRDRRDLATRLLTVGAGLLLTAVMPWSAFSNSSRAFDPGFYFSRVGGPFTANTAAFLVTVALLLLAAIAMIRAEKPARLSRAAAFGATALVLTGGLPLASNIVRGIGEPVWGSSPGLWLSWELPLFLFLFTILLTAAHLFAKSSKTPRLASRTVILIAFVSALLATAALWSTTSRERMRLAERDVAGLMHIDDYELLFVRRFVDSLSLSPAPKDPAALLQRYAASELAAAEYPVFLETRSARGSATARVDLAPGATDSTMLSAAAPPSAGAARVTTVLGPTGVQILGIARHLSGEVTTVVVLPHTRVIAPLPFAALLGMKQRTGGDPPYTVSLSAVSPEVIADFARVRWQRIGDQWHGDRLVPTSAGARRAHVEVDLRSFSARGERAALIILLDLAVAGFLWLLGAVTERPFGRWLVIRTRRWMRSYRPRLTLALFGFFVVPAIAFAIWSYQRLRSDDRQTRELLVFGTLGTVAESQRQENLSAAAERFDTPLFSYAGGFLSGASDSLYGALPPAGLALPPGVHQEISGRGELTAAWQHAIAGQETLFGYRAALGPNEERYVVAAPARSDELVLDRRRRDLGIFVLFSTNLGALAALWLSGVAAKRLARDLELSRIEVARAERVIAWGEMARQVAHEIKNPLTPIRLGVQHLRRARMDARADFDKVLDENVGRILSEIDRLDSIARSFSRYGSPPADLLPAQRVDVAAVVRDVIGLEQMGKSDVKWKLRGVDRPLIAMARGDELRDVLLNVLENARLAGAHRVDVILREEERRITIEACDDGSGISAANLSRIFEPHFSTRTTGSGLGLPASRRIIEHWGGEIVVTSEEGRGARVLIALVRPQ